MSAFDLEKINEFYNSYVSAGLSNSSNAKFLKSLLNEKNPPKGRGIDWLNDIFEKGKPSPPSKEQLEFSNHLVELSNRLQHEEEKNTLKEFSKKISSCQELTENQRNYMNVLIDRAKAGYTLIKANEEIASFIRAIEGKIKFGVSGYYWNSRPGTYRRAFEIFNLFSSKNEISDNDLTFLREIFRSWTSQWESADSLKGQLMYYKNEPVLVLGNKRSIGDGVILVDVVYNGSTKSVNVGLLQKRMKKC